MNSLYISPYLRPFRFRGALWLDDYRAMRMLRLSEAQEAVVRALWDPEGAAAAIEALRGARGSAEVDATLAELAEGGIVYGSAAECDAAFFRTLEQAMPTTPYVEQVELTNHCPMRCGFCPRGVEGRITRPKGFMEVALLRRLVEQLNPKQSEMRSIELHHLGESLLHPQLIECVEAVTRRGVLAELSVNPSHLAPHLARGLLDAGIFRLIVSLDGMDDETLAAIRGPAASYTKAERNLTHLLELLAKMEHPPIVVLQMIDLHRNRHQREAFLARWGQTGLPNVRAYIKDLDGADPELGVPTKTPQLHVCTYLWRSVSVLWDGRVVPCCRDDDGHLVLGDLNHQSLAAIWNGPAAMKLRFQHRTGMFPPGHLCADCAWNRQRFAHGRAMRHPDDAKEEPIYGDA